MDTLKTVMLVFLVLFFGALVVMGEVAREVAESGVPIWPPPWPPDWERVATEYSKKRFAYWALFGFGLFLFRCWLFELEDKRRKRRK